MINNRYLNTYFNNNLESIILSNTEIDENNIILDNNIGNVIDNDIEFLNTIIQHPFIDNLIGNYDELFKNNINKKYNLINYRINTSYKIPFVEFYLDNINTFQFIFINNLKNYICNKNSTKKIQGILNYKEENFIVIRNRYNKNNYEYKNWVTIYDIVKNKYYYEQNISTYIVDFFINNFKLSNLFMNNKLLLTPIILYTYIDEKYFNYINKHNSIMFCQNETCSYVKLTTYDKNDNIRVICFIDDIEYSKNIIDLEKNDYILLNSYNHKNNISYNEWIFKNESKNIYIVKK